MEQQGISIRYDEGRGEFVLSLAIKMVGDFEATGETVSDALSSLAEQLAEAGI